MKIKIDIQGSYSTPNTNKINPYSSMDHQTNQVYCIFFIPNSVPDNLHLQFLPHTFTLSSMDFSN